MTLVVVKGLVSISDSLNPIRKDSKDELSLKRRPDSYPHVNPGNDAIISHLGKDTHIQRSKNESGRAFEEARQLADRVSSKLKQEASENLMSIHRGYVAA